MPPLTAIISTIGSLDPAIIGSPYLPNVAPSSLGKLLYLLIRKLGTRGRILSLTNSSITLLFLVANSSILVSMEMISSFISRSKE